MTEMLPIAILAGGLATRLYPLTEKLPKALVEVSGRPFISWQLNYLRRSGLSKVVICTGYLGHMIEEFVGDGDKFDLSIKYSHDGPYSLGTGGALKKAIPSLGDDFFVLYGDSFLPINFMEVEKNYLICKEKALMTVLRNKNQWDRSNVLFQNGKLIEYNKKSPTKDMTYIDYGLSIFSSSCFDGIELNLSFDLSQLLNKLSLEGELKGYEVTQRFYEIGTRNGLEETCRYFNKEHLV